MAKFVTHDALASGLFNRNFCCGDSLNGGAWRETLGNSPAVLSLLLERMNSDIFIDACENAKSLEDAGLGDSF